MSINKYMPQLAPGEASGYAGQNEPSSRHGATGIPRVQKGSCFLKPAVLSSNGHLHAIVLHVERYIFIFVGHLFSCIGTLLVCVCVFVRLSCAFKAVPPQSDFRSGQETAASCARVGFPTKIRTENAAKIRRQ